jgi:hypothetical protein
VRRAKEHIECRLKFPDIDCKVGAAEKEVKKETNRSVNPTADKVSISHDSEELKYYTQVRQNEVGSFCSHVV